MRALRIRYRKQLAARRQLGVILYEGPSLLDGVNIVAILTYKSRNAKEET